MSPQGLQRTYPTLKIRMVLFQPLPQAVETRRDDEDDHMQDVKHIPPAPVGVDDSSNYWPGRVVAAHPY